MTRLTKAHQHIAPIGYQPKDLFDPREVSIRDGEISLLTLTDGPLHDAIKAIPDDLLMMPEHKLKKHCNPDELTCRLRISFWDEYNAAVDNERAISAANIMRGLTYTEYFYKAIISDEKKIAWIIKPPQDYLLAMRDLLYLGMEKLRELLSQPLVEKVPVISKGMPVYDKDGQILYQERLNSKLASEIRQITERLSDRVHGAVVQRMSIDQKSASLHVHANADPLRQMPIDQLQELDNQLTTINQKLALSVPPAVTFEEKQKILVQEMDILLEP